ncbi:hypothetical protein ZWY2020_003421 [Hordeum vulgare]|nr:hypothetical protein ZWY2020_003421 [Hordeum vulgare]
MSQINTTARYGFRQKTYNLGPVQTNVMDGINAGGLQSRRCLRKKQVQEGRNRASPARLVRLNKILDQTQRDLIENEYFMGGIVKIETTTMPADLSRWVLQRSHIVHKQHGFESGSAREITTFCKMIEDMNGRADDDFMRAWLIVAVITFMCPTTSLHIRYSLGFMSRKKKAVNCCVHHMVVLYVDSLVVDIQVPDCPALAEAWDNKRIVQFANSDKKLEGASGAEPAKDSANHGKYAEESHANMTRKELPRRREH